MRKVFFQWGILTNRIEIKTGCHKVLFDALPVTAAVQISRFLNDEQRAFLPGRDVVLAFAKYIVLK